MLEDKIDVGDNDEIETEIDLDAPAPEQSLEEEIKVEEVNEPVAEETATEEKPVEAKPKEELEEYSDGVQKRIAKLTRKMREAERQKEEAIKFAQQANNQAQKIRNQYENLGTNYTKELAAKVNNGMDAAKLAYKSAIENQDVDAQIEAQRAIAQMSMEEARLKQINAAQEQRAARPQPQPQNLAQAASEMPTAGEVAQAGRELDPKAEDWASKNRWFGTDNAMTYTAFDIHKNLVEEEGFDPQSNEYYVEVDKRIRVAFPHKFDKVEQSTNAPVQNVASARRPAANKGRRKTVKLTPSQVAISKRLGVPLEEYAKQLAAKEV
jgi:hypothetical protein